MFKEPIAICQSAHSLWTNTDKIRNHCEMKMWGNWQSEHILIAISINNHGILWFTDKEHLTKTWVNDWKDFQSTNEEIKLWDFVLVNYNNFYGI